MSSAFSVSVERIYMVFCSLNLEKELFEYFQTQLASQLAFGYVRYCLQLQVSLSELQCLVPVAKVVNIIEPGWKFKQWNVENKRRVKGILVVPAIPLAWFPCHVSPSPAPPSVKR